MQTGNSKCTYDLPVLKGRQVSPSYHAPVGSHTYFTSLRVNFESVVKDKERNEFFYLQKGVVQKASAVKMLYMYRHSLATVTFRNRSCTRLSARPRATPNSRRPVGTRILIVFSPICASHFLGMLSNNQPRELAL